MIKGKVLAIACMMVLGACGGTDAKVKEPVAAEKTKASKTAKTEGESSELMMETGAPMGEEKAAEKGKGKKGCKGKGAHKEHCKGK